MGIREKMRLQFYFDSCHCKGQDYDGKNFHQKFVISGSVSMMQRCIINNSKNKNIILKKCSKPSNFHYINLKTLSDFIICSKIEVQISLIENC